MIAQHHEADSRLLRLARYVLDGRETVGERGMNVESTKHVGIGGFRGVSRQQEAAGEEEAETESEEQESHPPAVRHFDVILSKSASGQAAND
jgi:hypothetical protein